MIFWLGTAVVEKKKKMSPSHLLKDKKDKLYKKNNHKIKMEMNSQKKMKKVITKMRQKTINEKIKNNQNQFNILILKILTI